MSLFLACESAAINNTAKEAPLPFTVRESMVHRFRMVFGDSMDCGHLHCLPRQHLLWTSAWSPVALCPQLKPQTPIWSPGQSSSWTSTWLQVAAWIMDISMAPRAARTVEVYSKRSQARKLTVFHLRCPAVAQSQGSLPTESDPAPGCHTPPCQPYSAMTRSPIHYSLLSHPSSLSHL